MKKLAFFLVLVACVFVFGTESVSSQLKAFTDGQAAELQEWETRQQENHLFDNLRVSLAAQIEPLNPNQPNIVGGQEAQPGAWPWQVALVNKKNVNPGPDYYGAQFCGGSLVTQNWVLTAAHCLYPGGQPIAASELAIVAGIHSKSTPEAGFQEIDIAELVPHPDYDPVTLNNDLALLRLAQPVSLGVTAGGEYVYRIPLVPKTIGDLADQMATVTGWGDTSKQLGIFPDKLQQVEVPILDNATCQIYVGSGITITSNMLCAGYEEGGKNSCFGDSGGPLVIHTGGQWQQAGVVSFSVGEGCAQPNLPSGHTRLSTYTDWIEGNISELEPWCTANQQTWDDNVRTCTVDSGSEIIGGPQTILSGEVLVNNGTITMNNDQHIINDGNIDNFGIIENNGNIDNFGTLYNDPGGDIYNEGDIYNDGDIDNFGFIENNGYIWGNGDIYNEGTIDNFGVIWNYGTIDNLGALYNPGIIGNNGTINNWDTIWNEGWNDGTIWNYETINNNGTIWNDSIVYNMGVITVNPVNSFDRGVVYEMHNHLHLPLIMSSG